MVFLLSMMRPPWVVCMSVIKEKSLKIPNDIAVVGYDDETYSQYLSPSLTTVRNPIFEMGEYAAYQCLDQIENRAEF